MPANVPPTEQSGRYGALLDAAEFGGAPVALAPEALAPAGMPPPSRASLTHVPPVVAQGSAGACEALAYGYGLGSYTAARSPAGAQLHDISRPENQVSAAYLYKCQLHAQHLSCPAGTLAIPHLDRLVRDGAPSAQDVPYTGVCSDLEAINRDTPHPNAARFRIGSFAILNIQQDPPGAISTIKQLIASGCAVVFSGPVIRNYEAPLLNDEGVLGSTETIPGSGLSQLIIGFDDEQGAPGEPGAFLVQNSFGAAWPPVPSPPSTRVAAGHVAPPPGTLLWSYASLATQLFAATAYPLDTTPFPTPSLGQFDGPGFDVGRAFQWAPNDSKDVWLIVFVRFSAPVKLNQVKITERMSGTEVTGQYGHHFSNGYLYFKRSDENQFLADWGLDVIFETLAGVSFDYDANLTVEPARPASPPASEIGEATDMLGQPAQVVSRSQ